MTDLVTTKQDLVEAFREIGVEQGMEVMVHSSLSALGFVVNGPLDVIDAMLDVVGESGTVLMPAHTGQLTDPADWRSPAIPAEDVERVRRSLKPLDTRTTPIRNRGVVAQTFLTYPGVVRSDHPLNSVIASGRRAAEFTKTHPLHASEGPDSPIGKLYDAGGHVLLLGVSFTRCTAIHLAEFIADVPYLTANKLRVLVARPGGGGEFVRLERYPNGSDGFDKVRTDFPTANVIRERDFRRGRITFFPIRPVVDYVVERLREDSSYLTGKNS